MKDSKGNPIQAGDRVLLHGTVEAMGEVCTKDGNFCRVHLDGSGAVNVHADKLHVVSHGMSDHHDPIDPLSATCAYPVK